VHFFFFEEKVTWWTKANESKVAQLRARARRRVADKMSAGIENRASRRAPANAAVNTDTNFDLSPQQEKKNPECA